MTASFLLAALSAGEKVDGVAEGHVTHMYTATMSCDCMQCLSQSGREKRHLVRAKLEPPWNYQNAMQHAFLVSGKRRLSIPPQHVPSGSGPTRVASTRGRTIPVQDGFDNLALCQDVTHCNTLTMQLLPLTAPSKSYINRAIYIGYTA